MATRLQKFRKGRGGTLHDPVRRHGSWEATPEREPTVAERRVALRACLAAPQPALAFWRAPEALRSMASRGALRALARGDVGWAREVARHVFRGQLLAVSVRPVALRVLARRPERAVELAPLLGLVGGATDVLEALFERFSPTEAAQHLEVAAALVRCRPGHVAAARVIARRLRHRDPQVRGKAACALTIWDGRGRGAGATLLRACLDEALARPDPHTFFLIEHLLFDRSRHRFLQACERLLSSRLVGDFATERLAAHGDRRQRAVGLEAGLRKRNFLDRWLFFGRHMPLSLRLRHVRIGLARPSPFERIATSWALDRETHSVLADEITRALEDDPELEVRREWTRRIRALGQRPQHTQADRPYRSLRLW